MKQIINLLEIPRKWKYLYIKFKNNWYINSISADEPIGNPEKRSNKNEIKIVINKLLKESYKRIKIVIKKNFSAIAMLGKNKNCKTKPKSKKYFSYLFISI